MTIRTAILLSLTLCACAGTSASLPDDSVLGGEGRTEHERELNRAALEELRERAVDAPERPTEPNDGLAVVVLEPERPSALTEAGALKRSAVLEFLELGPHALLGAVTLEPARTQSGSAQGFRIAELHEGSAFLTEAGLQRGDIVSEVNGRSILLPDAFIEVWEGMADAPELRVDVLRDGEELVLEWPIDDDA